MSTFTALIVALVASTASADEVKSSSTNTILGKGNDVVASDDNIVLGQANSVQGKMLQQSTYIRTRYFGSASSDSASFLGALGNDTFAGGVTLTGTTTSTLEHGATSSTISAGSGGSATAAVDGVHQTSSGGGTASVANTTQAGAGASDNGAAAGSESEGALLSSSVALL